MPTPGLLLEADRLSCDYAGRPAVRELSLDLRPGELGCLLGPSGCGKTTLLRAIAGLHPPASGALRLRGRDALPLPPEQRGLGFVFQDLALFPHLSVAGNVGFGLHRLQPAARRERVAATLALLGLDGLGGRYPHELSGGQQQRVALARSLAPRPDLLLLDEPFSSLDADLRGRLRDELRILLKQLGIAALLVTHDQEEAFAFADRVGVMQGGRLLQWAPGFELYHRPATPFVASFVGEGRLLPARVAANRRLRTPLGELDLPAGLECAEGSRVQVLLRPDDLVLSEHEGIEAEVGAVAFRGAESLHTLVLADGTALAALFPSHQQKRVGERVRVRPDLAHVVVFPAAADG
ncbi:ABC transporter ATP-binding protein [Arenimonas fontis]|uniref:ABC transporter ATP-binding protein n=1 Tax=Arenimonas fontis TaxID=2608255 RepID=A0A5B2Z9P8_9GAMM|nr:ABC transporter ATP-binding protein [Arenimonas fontis]KAA2283924.1 ABC transporter ATP-binding protein [Arenimonas fontis]